MSEAEGREASEIWVPALPLLPDKGGGPAYAEFGSRTRRTWTPINISYKGQRVFRFSLNSKGFDTERIQASLIQQFPPCNQSLQPWMGPLGTLRAQGSCAVSTHGYLSLL